MKEQEKALLRSTALARQGIDQNLHLGMQLCVILRGETVSDIAIGQSQQGVLMTPSTINLWLSAGKPMTAVAIAQLWERGKLAIDDPVTRFVPEFSQHNKGDITLRHLLTHTAGIRGPMDTWANLSWDEITQRICALRPEPRWRPGRRAGYHAITSWHLLGEIVQRISGRPFREYARDEIFLPLKMDDCYLGMTQTEFEQQQSRMGLVYHTQGGALSADHPRNTMGGVLMPRPGANARGPMNQLARFYRAMLSGGALEGRRILQPQTVAAMTAAHRVGLMDETFKRKMDWGLGFLLESSHYGGIVPYGYGGHASPRTFGHGGHETSSGFADPEHDLVVAVFFNGMPGPLVHQERMHTFLTALYEDLDLAHKAQGE